MARVQLLLFPALALLALQASCFTEDNSQDILPWASREDIERIYWDGRAQADRALSALWKDQDRLANLQNGSNYAYELWDLFPPYYNCPSREKIGNQPEDGGKWMCGVNTLLPSSGCVVYSFGSNGETSWERALLERAPQCEVHVFDPTLTEDIQQQVDDVEGITFHNIGLGAEDGMRVLKRTDHAGRAVPSKLQTLGSIMESLGHTWIDILKVDIEGAEWEVLQEVLDNKGAGRLPFTQLQIELHYPWQVRQGGQNALKIMGRLTHEGNLRVFNREYNPCCHWALIEYAFIQVSQHGQIITSGSSARKKRSNMQAARHFLQKGGRRQ